MAKELGFHAAKAKSEIPDSSIGFSRVAKLAAASDNSGAMTDLEILTRRLRERMDELGVRPVPTSLKARLGRDFLTDLLNGRKKSVRAEALGRIARALDCSIEYLINPDVARPNEVGHGGPASGGIQIVGYIGAASEYFGFDDHARGAGLEEIERPPGAPENAVAVIVRGDSGWPAIRDGMVLVYWNRLEDPSSVVGEDCFVRLADGRTLVKLLERGDEPGRWTLVSINASTPPIRNVVIEWAAPIEIRLRRRNWKSPI